MENLIFIGDRCNDHSPSSGYDQLCTLYPRSGWLSGKAFETGEWKWIREPAHAIDYENLLFHVIYGDCSGKSLPALLKQEFPRSKIVSSVHQPVPRLLADPIAKDALSLTDVIITVSQVQFKDFTDLQIDTPVVSIPHGVWTHIFFDNDEAEHRKQSSPLVLVVGSFLRDWDGATYVLQKLSDQGIRVKALGAGPRKNLLIDLPNVEILPRISEKELIMLYREASVVFLPFLEATASNALLEAMAIGCPIVCPHLESLIEEYLHDSQDSFSKCDYDLAIERMLHYVNNPEERTQKAFMLKNRARLFDWSKLTEQFTQVYSELVPRNAVA